MERHYNRGGMYYVIDPEALVNALETHNSVFVAHTKDVTKDAGRRICSATFLVLGSRLLVGTYDCPNLLEDYKNDKV